MHALHWQICWRLPSYLVCLKQVFLEKEAPYLYQITCIKVNNNNVWLKHQATPPHEAETKEDEEGVLAAASGAVGEADWGQWCHEKHQVSPDVRVLSRFPCSRMTSAHDGAHIPDSQHNERKPAAHNARTRTRVKAKHTEHAVSLCKKKKNGSIRDVWSSCSRLNVLDQLWALRLDHVKH